MTELVKWLAVNSYARTDQALKNANRLLKKQFIFENPYDMEAYRQVISFDTIDWLYTPNQDPEWTYMLNRHEYLLDLLVASQLTDETNYLDCGKEFILDWIEACQDQPANAWRTIDTGIRLMYWALLLRAFLDCEGFLTAEEEAVIKGSIQSQVSYLDQQYIEKYELSNWGVLISSGIVVMKHLHPDLVKAESYQININRLVRQCQLQVQESGLHWEQSPLYFMEVWRQLSAVWLSFSESQSSCPESIEKTIKKMLKASSHLVKPDSYLLQQGDTDRIQITDMIQTMSLLMVEKLPTYLAQGLQVDLLLCQLIDQGDQELLKWPGKLARLSTSDFPNTLIDHQTGNYFYRSHWENHASFLHVYNGPLSSGHGHASLGHIDFTYQGLDILIDPGRYTYQEIPERLFLKSVEAHNVVTINQQAFCQPRDSWGYSKGTTPLSNQVTDTEEAYAIQINYNDVQEQGVIRVTRTYLWLKAEELLLIFDYCQGASLERVDQRLTFNPNLKIEERAEGLVIEGQTLKDNLLVHSNYQSRNLVSCLYSEIYNELSTTKQSHAYELPESDRFLGYTVIGSAESKVRLAEVKQSGSANQVPVDQCFAVTIETEDHQYVVAIQSEDTYQGHKLYLVNDQPIYGKLTVLTDGEGSRIL